jgi:hypothetical protein
MGVEFFYANGRTDGRMDMTKLIVAFRSFANTPINRIIFLRRLFIQYLDVLTDFNKFWLYYLILDDIPLSYLLLPNTAATRKKNYLDVTFVNCLKNGSCFRRLCCVACRKKARHAECIHVLITILSTTIGLTN